MKKGKSNWTLLVWVFFFAFSVLCFVQNTSAGDRSDVEDFVTRFYEECLGRSPDPGGLKAWVDALLDGTQTGSDVAYGFVFSPEFIEKDTNNDQYLQVLYEAFFNRQPDPAGLQGWLNAMQKGTSREDVLKGFIYAKEFNELCRSYGIMPNPVTAFVTRFYQLCLKRDPDIAGLDSWVASLLSGENVGADVAEGFIFSPEFTKTIITDEEYMKILYRAFFNRDPDPSGLQGWLDVLNSGTSRAEVLKGFIYSQEFAELCHAYGIKAFLDNTKFFGRYSMNISIGSCSEPFDATIGDDFSKIVEDGYLYLPAIGSPSPYSYYDDVGNYITTSVTLSRNRLTMREEGLRRDGSRWVTILHIDFGSDYNSFTLSGIETDDDPSECQGAISGSGGRL